MSLLKNILIVGLFLSVFVAVSPAFATSTNNKNLVTTASSEIFSNKSTARILICSNLVST